jgi:predicted DsbA family dithiol-disulfide isomerase
MAYWRPGGLTCGNEYDCDQVIASRFGKIADVPLPVVGILGFAAIFGCSLSSSPRGVRWLRFLALVAAVAGCSLLFIQFFVLIRLCQFCLIVDLSALVIGLAALGWHAEGSSFLSVRARRLWLGAALAALGLGAAFGSARSWMSAESESPPPEVKAHWVPGRITIVELVDFQCPLCRKMHLILTAFLREQGDRIHLVRIVAPMEMHPQARDAARAYLCAVAQNKGDEMAEKLFETGDLSPANCEHLALSLGLSAPQFRACVSSQEIDRQLDANLAWVNKGSPQGLPCIWIQDLRLSGLQTYNDLAVAFTTVEQRLRNEGREASPSTERSY